jgi:hypothetical protein
LNLPLEHFSKQLHSLGNALHREAKISRHLPGCIVRQIGGDYSQVCIQGVGSFAFLQKLLRLLNQFGGLGPVVVPVLMMVHF